MQFLAILGLAVLVFIGFLIYPHQLMFWGDFFGINVLNYVPLCDPNQNELGFAACNIERDAMIARGVTPADEIPVWLHALSVFSTALLMVVASAALIGLLALQDAWNRSQRPK